MANALGLQLYTLREALERDYAGTIEKVAAAGYAGVEPGGFPGSSLEEAKSLYDKYGLVVSSAHAEPPVGEQEERVIENAQALGITRLVGGQSRENYVSLDLVKRACALFNRAAQNAANHGMTFSIHNHWWEFNVLEGRPAYEHMLEFLEPEVLFQIDTYWIKVAGQDPVEVLRNLKGRTPLLHIKDGPGTQGEDMTAVGEGVMDFQAIVDEVGNTVHWMIVELDRCATDMMTAVEKSAAYMLGKGFAHGR